MQFRFTAASSLKPDERVRFVSPLFSMPKAAKRSGKTSRPRIADDVNSRPRPLPPPTTHAHTEVLHPAQTPALTEELCGSRDFSSLRERRRDGRAWQSVRLIAYPALLYYIHCETNTKRKYIEVDRGINLGGCIHTVELPATSQLLHILKLL